MSNTSKHLMSTLVIVWLLTIISRDSAVAQVGVCYGQNGNNLPPPSKVVSLYKENNIKRMRLYAPDPPTLDALCGSGIELMLGVPNQDLPHLASRPSNAKAWVQGNITRYPNVQFRYITAGNEIEPNSTLAQYVYGAMRNLQAAVCEAGLGDRISISTSINFNLIENSYPPENGTFKAAEVRYIKPILEFLAETRSPLLASVYPYFAYRGDPVHVPLQYALLQPNSGICIGDVYYDNLFYAQVDAVYAAIDKLMKNDIGASLHQKLRGIPSKEAERNVRVAVSETGFSSKEGGKKMSVGDDGSGPSTVENARIYNNNLMRIVKKGTPMRPGQPIETYIFAMFDENEKPGDESEKHFGIFLPSGKPKYKLCFY
ncbi:glucan endo-1,3-beta-glucosidase, acidic-like [Salvia miltiorrhiza]|uniref:glucan endo-1,3-beta-glucosidase, acidic-like n=1 Tax=Salvia miltiorrhiza TaxID=226208 RepID=UPI0025AC239F|nr:glucan endo-1,3-beta-glucosidase, acidic-like [Salvia miltiorrhiza]